MNLRSVLAVLTVPAGLAFLALAGPPSAPPGAGGPPSPPPPRAIPGVTAADPFPNGCVDCHLDRPEIGVDARFATSLAGWTEAVRPELLARAQAAAPPGLALRGKHPPVPGALADIPRSCLACHGGESTTAPPFSRLIHGIHLSGGEKNHYLTLFQGECTYCHKLNAQTGALTLASAAER